MACLKFVGFVLGIIMADHLYQGILGGTSADNCLSITQAIFNIYVAKFTIYCL